MKKTARPTQIPLLPREHHEVLELEGEEVLSLSLRWQEGAEGCPKNLARLLGLAPAVWLTRWRGEVFRAACGSLGERRARSRPFDPWVCRLETEVTQNGDGLFRVVWTVWEQRGDHRLYSVAHTLTWDLAENAPVSEGKQEKFRAPA